MSAQNGHSSYKIILDGETVAQVGDDLSPASQQGYTGHVGDNTGLVYMQARYYDPVIGRFYSNDPADVMEHIARGNPIHGFNRYTYANNNPYKHVDPDGEFGLLGAAVGATGRLAGAAVAKIGLTGAEAAATVLIPSSGVAAVGGAVTQMVENTANGDPLNKGVALSAGAAATGTIVGGVTGDKIVGALTKSPVMGEAGKLAGGKATGEAIAIATQEGIAQGITNSCTGEICE